MQKIHDSKQFICKVFLVGFVIISACFITPDFVFADRNTAIRLTTNTSQLIKRGEGLLYSVSFVATSAGGDFVLRDATSDTGLFSDVTAEGSEATSLNGGFQDYTKKPLEFTAGLYLTVTNGYVIVRYE